MADIPEKCRDIAEAAGMDACLQLMQLCGGQYLYIALRLLRRVIQRRMGKEKALEDILADYPKLTETKREVMRQACSAVSSLGGVIAE